MVTTVLLSDVEKEKAEKLFKLIQNAYEVLMDEKKRASYDAELVQKRRDLYNENRPSAAAESSNSRESTQSPSGRQSPFNTSSSQPEPENQSSGQKTSGASGRSTPESKAPTSKSRKKKQPSNADRSSRTARSTTPTREMMPDPVFNLSPVTTILALRNNNFGELESMNTEKLMIDVLSEKSDVDFKSQSTLEAPLLSKKLFTPNEFLTKIENEYNNLKSQCCYCGFFDRLRSNFFDGAFEYAKKNLYVTVDKNKLTDIQKLWIILQYAEIQKNTRTKEAVKNVIKEIQNVNQAFLPTA